MSTICVHDLTQECLGRVFFGTLRLSKTFFTYLGIYPNVVVTPGGWKQPGFPENALLVVMTNTLDAPEKTWRILDMASHLGPKNKLLIVEHTPGNPPNPRVIGGRRMWSKECWGDKYFGRLSMDIRRYDFYLLCTVLMEVYQSSWCLSGDKSVGGRDLTVFPVATAKMVPFVSRYQTGKVSRQ